eukprot:11478221-Alexandrium_andersonii.AAC.1
MCIRDRFKAVCAYHPPALHAPGAVQITVMGRYGPLSDCSACAQGHLPLQSIHELTDEGLDPAHALSRKQLAEHA